MTCRAYQVSDQMICPCGLQWDMNDPDPPDCASGVTCVAPPPAPLLAAMVHADRVEYLAVIKKMYDVTGRNK